MINTYDNSPKLIKHLVLRVKVHTDINNFS